MPIRNGSQIWPKVLVCTKCSQPVLREVSKETRVGDYIYSCSSCAALVLPENMKWVEEGEGFDQATTKSDADNVADSNPIYR